MDINYELYKVFYHVAITLSFSEASKQLFISQSAVSQSIKVLEKKLNQKLFIRSTKRVQLTPEGEILFKHIEPAMNLIKQGENQLLEAHTLNGGQLRIGASDMTLQFYLLPYLEKFHEQYPGIKVIVTNAPTPETLNYLREGHIDFGIVSTPFPERPDIQMIPVREIEDVFVAGRRFFSYKNRTLDFQKLESLPLIFLEKNTSSRSYMDEFLAELAK